MLRNSQLIYPIVNCSFRDEKLFKNQLLLTIIIISDPTLTTVDTLINKQESKSLNDFYLSGRGI